MTYNKKAAEQFICSVCNFYSHRNYHPAALVAAGFSDIGKHSAEPYNSGYDHVHKGSAGVLGIPDGVAALNGAALVA